MGLIEIENMEFFSYHGCYDTEKIVGNKFLVNLWIKGDFSKSAKTDNINDAVNYQTAYELVKHEMDTTSNLLEHVCKRIIDQIYQKLNGIDEVGVKVSKMNPAMGGKMNKVSVTLVQ